MLRSTGFFRGIDCPFHSESCNSEAAGDGCKRPYCHFRHVKQRRSSYGAGDVKKPRDLSSRQNEQGYDPFSPEVVRPEEHQNGDPGLASPAGRAVDPGVMELEMVNRAIEAVQSELERSKRKLSRIGDQEYEPVAASTQPGIKHPKPSAEASRLAYDPESYQMTPVTDYNPTPRSSKYTLDSESEDSCASSLEYVPTAVTKTPVKKAIPPTPPCRPQLSSSLRGKYTLDTTKPPTDMEYDPLSNFSAKPAGMSSKEQRTMAAEAELRKAPPLTTKRKRLIEEEYVPTVKKLCQEQPVVDLQKYTAFSESEGESSGTEYRPTSLSRLQSKKGSSGPSEDTPQKVSRDSRRSGAWSVLKPQRSQEAEDVSSQWSSEDPESPNPDWLREKIGKTLKEKDIQTKSEKMLKVRKEEKGEKVKSQKPSQVGSRKIEKTPKKNTEDKNKLKKKSDGKCRKDERSSDSKSKKTEKMKGEQSHKEMEKKGTIKKHTSEKMQKDSKTYRDQKNGKLDSAGWEKDRKKVSQVVGSSRKDKSRKSSSKEAKLGKEKSRSLSHADLFGDESAEEEDEERIVRKSAGAHKRSGLVLKREGTEVKCSSSDSLSEEEGDGEDDEDCGSFDYSSLQADVEYDSDPMEECLRIFNESNDIKTEDKGRQAKQPSKEQDDGDVSESTLTTLFPGQKKRVSHFKAKGNAEPSRNTVIRPYRRATAQEICYRRMQMAQQQAEQLAAAVKTASSSASLPGERKRVAHRPKPPTAPVTKPAEAKQTGSRVLSPTKTVPDHLSVKAHTSAGILSKTMSTSVQKRVAHTPTLKSSAMKRPVIPTEFGAKVPTGVRQRYLNMFIDECLKFCTSEQTAFQMALDEEKVAYDRSSSKNIYLNVAVNTLKKLRTKSSMPPTPTTTTPTTTKSQAMSANRKAQSHEEVLGGRLAAKTSFTVNRMGKHQEAELTGAVLYRKLKEYMMTEEQLHEHGYPRPHPEKAGRAIVYSSTEKKITDPFSKVCCRCGAEYKINANGNCVRKEECSHHWGRLRRYRVPGGWETQYSCCSGSVGSPGCQVAKQHVQDGRKESLDCYVKTFDKRLPADGNAGVYALDCEMCYTRQGLELTRVTVINSDLKVIYDTFVKPESKVVDYNTRFSGVTEEDLENTTITLRDVQAVLLSMFSADSILIGHSLESDLLALKLMHSTVVDTAIVFPHRLGLPYKRALRTLMADYLKRIIQDNVEGHDSSEDASACMELMMWKIREDAKVKR
ncbi:RNA exonuclease 1 homolog [Denticeps clupeoides]|uniref:Exonuclease domain-containing protein n=1 Tax=Denticeps clupeoides TaxID=299321 RepID=A0AAY4AVF5_9TELE|nr:RNA exonuclease 1 homolog [Denticeps clupeoides]